MSTGQIELNGMVMRTAPAGEYDRRIVLRTRERGKITAFARGARKPGNALVAATVPFSFGTFRVYEGKSAYTCVSAEISNYFEGLKTDFEGACYGAYFMEFGDYYAQENLDAADMLNLLYVSLRMLERKDVQNRLVRYAFEVRLMVLGGEFPMDVTQDESLLLASRQAFYHMITAPLGKLFTFNVTDEVLDRMHVAEQENMHLIRQQDEIIQLLKEAGGKPEGKAERGGRRGVRVETPKEEETDYELDLH